VLGRIHDWQAPGGAVAAALETVFDEPAAVEAVHHVQGQVPLPGVNPISNQSLSRPLA
jgi:hypothetical protein